MRTRGILVSPEQLARCAPGSPLLELARAYTPRQDIEHGEQVKLFEWAENAAMVVPELHLLYAIPNFSGRGKSKGVRLRDGARLKAEGRKKGMLDICLPVPRFGYHALYVELKTEEGQLSPGQRWWLGALREQGCCAGVARAWESARDFILAYLGGCYL